MTAELTMKHAVALFTLSVVVACAGAVRPARFESNRLPGGEPILRMPFRRGVVVLCQQGNATGARHSHSFPNTMNALDLSTPGTDDTEIVAAAAGHVSHVVTGAVALGDKPGGGFGNHVVVDHGAGYSTLYAHLKTVAVKEGDEVAAGQLLGVMGDTGKAGNVHLHFSLHHVPFGSDGAPATTVIHGLLAADVTHGASFGIRTSLELECADSTVSPSGHLYASENGGGTPLIGDAPADLASAIAKASGDRSASIHDSDPVTAVLANLDHGGSSAVARDQLRAIQPTQRDYPFALYWIAVLSIRDLDDWKAAGAALAELASIHTDNPWLGPWTLVRQAQIADHEGRAADARELWAKAKAESYRDPTYTKLVDAAATKYGL
jgi:murein DD-endopeptidase MepM/ murein hydrolase activator NlpD